MKQRWTTLDWSVRWLARIVTSCPERITIVKWKLENWRLSFYRAAFVTELCEQGLKHREAANLDKSRLHKSLRIEEVIRGYG